MRFATIRRTPQAPLARVPAGDAVRRPAPGQPCNRSQAAPAKPAPELPTDLDQRVRLIGEW